VTPKRFSLTRFSWFAPLWNSAADILQCKADGLGFRSLYIISEASAFGTIIYIQILVKIIVIHLSDVWSLSRSNSNVFRELKLLRRSKVFTKSLNFIFSPNEDWLPKVFRKTAFHKRCTCCACKPFILETQRFLSDSVVRDLRVPHCCGTVRQKSCSACKADALGFRSLYIILGAGKITYIPDTYSQGYRYFPSQIFETSPAQILAFSENTFRCCCLFFLLQAISLARILWTL